MASRRGSTWMAAGVVGLFLSIAGASWTLAQGKPPSGKVVPAGRISGGRASATASARARVPSGPAGGHFDAAAAALYEKQCYSCHNIGGGDKKGPDLMGLLEKRDREWLHRFISTPMALKNAGDPTAVQLFAKYAPEEMADQMLAPDQVDEILELIEQHSRAKKTFVPQSGKLARRPTAADVPAGRRLFTGETRLKRLGPPCIGCHSVTGVGAMGGGVLGPDLTDACRRYSEVELASILKRPNFPVMSKLFGKKLLTDEEVVQLYAYLHAAKGREADAGPAGALYMTLGVGGMLAALGWIAFGWRHRLRRLEMAPALRHGGEVG